jgi:acetylornithine deacetylase/succinyl-diaminopimelate desuccinylase-like protein
MRRIAERRGVTVESREVQRTKAVQCSPRLQTLLANAITRAGVAPRHLPSGAGHDAMMFDRVTDLAMLFVRCGNGGVSHSPREIITAEDADLAARVLLDAVLHLAEAS